jgi:pimeloyl-ACP methyl ester carboxylesterase
MQQCSCLFNYGNHPFRISSRETTCKTRPFSFLHTWNDNKDLQSTASSKSSTATPPTVNLAYTDYYTPEDPESAGTPVLFLHGLLGSKRNFETLAARLGARLDTPRRIIGLDLRNHGASAETPIASMTYFEMAKDVLAFLDSQNLSKVILVGHSMGGKVSQTLALLTGTQRVEGLVVLDIAPVPYSSSEPHWKMVEEVLWACARADGTDKQTIDHQLKEVVPDPNLRAFCMTNFGKDSWKIPLDYIVDQLDNLAGFEVEGSSKYDGDVFIIHGGQSKFVRASHMEKISNFFPNHMLTTIRGRYHLRIRFLSINCFSFHSQLTPRFRVFFHFLVF